MHISSIQYIAKYSYVYIQYIRIGMFVMFVKLASIPTSTII